MNPLTSALVSRAFSAMAVLTPSRELVATSQRCSTFAASSPIRRNSSSNAVSFSRRARVVTCLVAAWAACASPRTSASFRRGGSVLPSHLRVRGMCGRGCRPAGCAPAPGALPAAAWPLAHGVLDLVDDAFAVGAVSVVGDHCGGLAWADRRPCVAWPIPRRASRDRALGRTPRAGRAGRTAAHPRARSLRRS